MAKLLARKQQIIAGVIHPASAYSRVVSCSETVTFGNPRAMYTVKVGQDIVLLGVNLFWEPYADDALDVTYFRVMTGTTEPQTILEMAGVWDNILPKLGAGHLDAPWYHQAGITGMSWTMNQHFTGIGRRFGMWMQTVMPGKGQACQASFEISEG